MEVDRKHLLEQLKKQMLALQGFKPLPIGNAINFGLGDLEACFPASVFPIGVIHEFICETPESTAASEAFISILLSKLMESGSSCLWISRNRRLFPPSMERFGVDAQQVIFIDLYYQKQILWVMEESLKCEGIACVIAEVSAIDFAQSRRLQLATEKSHVTGILLRKEPKPSLSATACTVRWKAAPLPSSFDTDLPGVGNPRWQIELLKVRNGHIGTFQFEWTANGLVSIDHRRQQLPITAERGQTA